MKDLEKIFNKYVKNKYNIDYSFVIDLLSVKDLPEAKRILKRKNDLAIVAFSQSFGSYRCISCELLKLDKKVKKNPNMDIREVKHILSSTIDLVLEIELETEQNYIEYRKSQQEVKKIGTS